MAHDGFMPVLQEALLVTLSGSAALLTMRQNPSEGSLLAHCDRSMATALATTKFPMECTKHAGQTLWLFVRIQP